LSQEALAEHLQVDRSTIARWESGASTPMVWIRPRLARVLGLDLDELDALLRGIAPSSAPAADLGGALGVVRTITSVTGGRRVTGIVAAQDAVSIEVASVHDGVAVAEALGLAVCGGHPWAGEWTGRIDGLVVTLHVVVNAGTGETPSLFVRRRPNARTIDAPADPYRSRLRAVGSPR
jgi:DNA-binding XRE family transcriptional regulator